MDRVQLKRRALYSLRVDPADLLWAVVREDRTFELRGAPRNAPFRLAARAHQISGVQILQVESGAQDVRFDSTWRVPVHAPILAEGSFDDLLELRDCLRIEARDRADPTCTITCSVRPELESKSLECTTELSPGRYDFEVILPDEERLCVARDIEVDPRRATGRLSPHSPPIFQCLQPFELRDRMFVYEIAIPSLADEWSPASILRLYAPDVASTRATQSSWRFLSLRASEPVVLELHESPPLERTVVPGKNSISWP